MCACVYLLRAPQVCFGPCQLPYCWQYCPAAHSSFTQALAAPLLADTSLLAAAAALELSPVVGLDLTSSHILAASQHIGGSISISSGSGTSSTAACTLQARTAPAEALIPAQLSMAATADVLAGILGVQAFHFACTSHTTVTTLQAWLRSMAAAVGVVAGDKGVSHAALCSLSGIGNLAAPARSAFSESLMSLKAELAAKTTVSSNSECGASRSRQWPLLVLCEVPAVEHELLPSRTASASRADQAAEASPAERRRAVLSVLQLCGRTMPVRPPSVCSLLELGLRQLGLADAKPASKALAALIQQSAAEMAAAPGGSAAGVGCCSQEQQQQQQLSSNLPVYVNHVRMVLRHLSGLQQRGGGTSLLPGCSAWHALQPLVTDLLIPQVAAQGHTSSQLSNSLAAALHAAQQGGSSSSSLPPAASFIKAVMNVLLSTMAVWAGHSSCGTAVRWRLPHELCAINGCRRVRSSRAAAPRAAIAAATNMMQWRQLAAGAC